jgi:hypothetical protein
MPLFSFSQQRHWHSPQPPDEALDTLDSVISERLGTVITRTAEAMTAKLGSRPALTRSFYTGSFYNGALEQGRVSVPLKTRIQVSADGDGTSVEVTLEENAWPHLMILGPLREAYRQAFASLLEAMTSATTT